jgi:hypothetical protein
MRDIRFGGTNLAGSEQPNSQRFVNQFRKSHAASLRDVGFADGAVMVALLPAAVVGSFGPAVGRTVIMFQPESKFAVRHFAMMSRHASRSRFLSFNVAGVHLRFSSAGIRASSLSGVVKD